MRIKNPSVLLKKNKNKILCRRLRQRGGEGIAINYILEMEMCHIVFHVLTLMALSF